MRAGSLRTVTSITAAMCGRGRSLSEPRLSPDGARVALVTRDGNGTRVVVVPVGGGPEVVVTTDPPPAFRGGVFDWTPDGSELVYASGAGGLHRTYADGGRATPVVGDADVASPAVSADGRIAFAADGLRRIEVVGLGPVSGAADFVVDPTWSPDGTRLAWHEWDVPDMPWDGSRIVMATDDGVTRTVAGGRDVAVQQPRFSPDGTRLAFLCDATGWLNLWTVDADGTGASVLVDEPHEHGGPTWGPGQRSFAWSPDGRTIAFTRNEEGFGRLCAVDVATGHVTETARAVHHSLTWRGDVLACVRTGARTPTALVAYRAGERRVLVQGPVGGFERAAIPEPEVVRWQSADGAAVHGRLYADAPGRPLLVWVHGGPTDQRQVEFDARLAYFVDRGWAVLFPDHRGSTGWGRAYAQALRGGWGVVDAEDTAAAVRSFGAGRRVALMGASAGGFTVLQVLASHPGLCAAGVALYPVSDVVDLAASTHRYEAHYAHHLQAVARVDAGRIRDPLLLLHGTDDKVVPRAQSAGLVARIRAAGGVVEYHEYEGEGHGWGRPATTEDELPRISSFLDRHVLGYGP
jgi:dipeptidyl aminopeptidase/acylaminoacyl peptidase